MIPIEFFTEISEKCADRPFVLLPEKDQEYYFSELKTIVKALLKKLADRNLTQTHGYYLADEMSKALEGNVFNEQRFSEALSHLDEIYGAKRYSKYYKEYQAADDASYGHGSDRTMYYKSRNEKHAKQAKKHADMLKIMKETMTA